MSRGRLGCSGARLRALVAAVVVLAGLAACCAGTRPAAAAGDPGLDGQIVTNPEPGWSEAPAEVEQLLAMRVTAGQAVAGQPAVRVADRVWLSPSGEGLAVALAAATGGAPSPGAALAAATSACSKQASASTPISVPGIPGSAEVSCLAVPPGSSSPSQVGIVAFTRGATFVLVLGFGGLTGAEAAPIALQQYGLLGTHGIGLLGLLLIVAVAGAAVAAVTLAVRGSRSRAGGTVLPATAGTAHLPPGGSHPGGGVAARYPAPGGGAYPPPQPGTRASAPAGWYPVGGNPYEQAYFDGSNWVAGMRWNGAAWVDAG